MKKMTLVAVLLLTSSTMFADGPGLPPLPPISPRGKQTSTTTSSISLLSAVWLSSKI